MCLFVPLISELCSRDNAGCKPADGAFGVANPSRATSNTKFNYSRNYLNSAGKAFWEYIHPYNETLGCAPDF
jgi:hypothetical protein